MLINKLNIISQYNNKSLAKFIYDAIYYIIK